MCWAQHGDKSKSFGQIHCWSWRCQGADFLSTGRHFLAFSIDKPMPAIDRHRFHDQIEAAPAYIGIDLEWSDPQSKSQSFWMLSRPDSAKVPEIWHFRPVSIIQIATLSPWMNWLKDGLVETFSTDMHRLMQYTPMYMKTSRAFRFKNHLHGSDSIFFSGFFNIESCQRVCEGIQ